MAANANVQTLRLRARTDEPKPPPKSHHTGILQDQVRRSARAPWTPSFSMAVRLLLLVRVSAAMYSNISDCDEVYNYWEPLHYLDKGYGFQTWETSPKYAIRSWAYILLHFLPARLAGLSGPSKRPAFFATRIFLAVLSTLCEAKFYRTVVEKINLRVGRYLFFMLLFSAGMWNASVAFLPSSFAMYAVTLAYSFALAPPRIADAQRTYSATALFAVGALLGWPFAIALAIPFVFEELFVLGGDRVIQRDRMTWFAARWKRLFTAGALASVVLVPIVLVDSYFYGKLTVTPWNIVSYNIFSDPARGPELYGTESPAFYFLNLALNFNLVLPMALLAIPSLILTYYIDRRRLYTPGAAPVSPDILQSSAYTVMGIRLLPVYIWLGILTAQAHKEERFVFPAYPLICFNAAVTLYLVRGWMEVAYVKVTGSSYQASRTSIFRLTTLSVILYTSLISLTRILALWHYYHAPLSVVFRLETNELPALLNSAGLLLPTSASAPSPIPTPSPSVKKNVPYSEVRKAAQAKEEADRLAEQARAHLDTALVRKMNLTLCIGKEWHRFPGHYLVPDGVDVQFVRGAFEGLVPGKFAPAPATDVFWSRRVGTSRVPEDQNDLNKAEESHYVDVDQCDYMLDLFLPHHTDLDPREPPYAISEAWEKAHCAPFLDAAHSATLTRTVWLPSERWQATNAWGEWCLLRSKGLQQKVKQRVAKAI
ncbi:asparagine-linked glycosylation 9 protein isoform a [Punctularia strigosozonata HHB-11173 SS5]|uniref:asparagine-linked glycosylation 9 protein isoform a n=1 Tax=Punctularia strigosozonata (strain HHB-11173) TaxID=741275 RepID=UPI0004416368|nr:asparagine-linked glycosylation 9 protein isoform a [Punctularia strigosozonata HHB-11173 SS5]EIN13913.1 asparagine-linked glycosylation 9 protein isoform a [Punctularia strigosozonata HHB-11173 SS5]